MMQVFQTISSVTATWPDGFCIVSYNCSNW